MLTTNTRQRRPHIGVGFRVAGDGTSRTSQRRLLLSHSGYGSTDKGLVVSVPWGRRFRADEDNRRPLWMLRLPRALWRSLPW